MGAFDGPPSPAGASARGGDGGGGGGGSGRAAGSHSRSPGGGGAARRAAAAAAADSPGCCPRPDRRSASRSAGARPAGAGAGAPSGERLPVLNDVTAAAADGGGGSVAAAAAAVERMWDQIGWQKSSCGEAPLSVCGELALAVSCAPHTALHHFGCVAAHSGVRVLARSTTGAGWREARRLNQNES